MENNRNLWFYLWQIYYNLQQFINILNIEAKKNIWVKSDIVNHPQLVQRTNIC